MTENCDEAGCDSAVFERLRSDYAVCKRHAEEWDNIYDEPYEESD